jgi:NAD(P)-dependent dehydrogenase (short-subunit alcohol dehydrogenase family)
MTSPRPLLLAPDTPSMHTLGAALEADLVALPALDNPDDFEAWRDEVAAGPERSQIVVCLWIEGAAAKALIDVDDDLWAQRLEAPYLLWNLALGAAARRCAAGGSIAALVQTPAALDAAGWTLETSIADGVVALARSLAASEGARGVRVNAVTTPLGLIEPPVIAPAPPLASFPGRLDREIAGAVRLMLSADAAGLTGRVVGADGGRSLA